MKTAVHKPIVLTINVSVKMDTPEMDTTALVSHTSKVLESKYVK